MIKKYFFINIWYYLSRRRRVYDSIKKVKGISARQKKQYLQESETVMKKYDSFLKDSASLSKGIIFLGIASLIAYGILIIQNL